MEKDRSARLIAIVALVLAVTGVSIGFAVLSTNLTIQPIDASVKANEKLFKVFFSSSKSDYQTQTVTAQLTGGTGDAGDQFQGNQLTIQPNSTTLTGIGGTFTEPGQTIKYELGISNIGKINGFLTGITFNNVDSTNSLVKCEGTSGGNDLASDKLTTACNDIKVTVKVNGTEYKGSNANITKQEIDANATQEVEVIIEYSSSATPLDGDFKATFGSISLTYQTKDNAVI